MMRRILGTGLLSGTVQGSLGVGGGILMIGGLTRFAGLKHAVAVGSSLPCQIVSNASAGLIFVSNGFVDPVALLCIGGTSMFSVRLGARIGHNLSENAAKSVFGAVLTLISPIVAYSSCVKNSNGDDDDGGEEAFDENKKEKKNTILNTSTILQEFRERSTSEITRMVCCGLGVGVLSGAMGIGATPVMLSYLTLSGDSHGSYKSVLGTAICSVTLTTLSGFTAYSSRGSVKWRMLPMLIIASALGGVAGSNLALEAPSNVLQCAFALFCGAYGARVVHRTWIRKLT